MGYGNSTKLAPHPTLSLRERWRSRVGEGLSNVMLRGPQSDPCLSASSAVKISVAAEPLWIIRGCFSQGQKLPGRWWRAEERATGASKGHGQPAKKYIRPVFMFGRLSGNRIPDVLIAWNESDRRSDGEIVENFHSLFVVN